MRSVVIESGRARRPPRGSVMVSVLAHGVLVAAAVIGTAKAPARPARDVDRLVPVALRPPAIPSRRGPAPLTGWHARTPRLAFDVPDVEIAIPGTSVPDPATEMSEILKPGDRSPGGSLTAGMGAANAPVAEEIAIPLPGNQEPRYPDVLRSTGMTGMVLARFVITEAGRVDTATLRIAQATHPLFGDAVRRALASYRYLPARSAGRPVPLLVEQRFEFELR